MTTELQEFKNESITAYGKEQRINYSMPQPYRTNGGKDREYPIFNTEYNDYGVLDYEFKNVSKKEHYEINNKNILFVRMKLKRLRKQIWKDQRNELKEFRGYLTWNLMNYENNKNYSVSKWFDICDGKMNGEKIKHTNYLNHILKREHIMKKVMASKLLSDDDKSHLDYIGKFKF